MFGSDFPFFNPKDILRKVLNLDIKDEEKEMILYKNAERVLRL
jgi:predicted TIM-barrel fold metal-dependent hydrolase